MKLDLLHPEIQFALNSVKQAMQLAKQIQAETAGHSLAKTDKSPVTIADFAIQALVGALLLRTFPNDPLVGEESAATLKSKESEQVLSKITHYVKKILPEANPKTVCDWIDCGTGKTSQRFWTLDPIDGTRGFLRGGQYAVALALIVKGRVELGILGCPHLNTQAQPEVDANNPGAIFIAVKGKGAWSLSANDSNHLSQLHVSSCVNPRQALILNSVEMSHTDVREFNSVMCTLGLQRTPFLMDSLAKHAVVAAGQADIFFRSLPPKDPNYRTAIWDEAAGALLVEEAGGKMSDLYGKPLDFSYGETLANNVGVVATNGHLHQAVLEALAKARS